MVFFGLILLLPYFLNVNDDSWLLARTLGIIFYPTAFSWLIQRYFKDRPQFKNKHFAVIAIPEITLMAFLLLGTTPLINPSAPLTTTAPPPGKRVSHLSN